MTLRTRPRDGLLAASTVAAPDANPGRHLLVLHGVYGRGRNWTTIARRFAAARPDWDAILLDLRQHGESPAFAPPHTIDAAATDVAAFEDATALHAAAALGHSFGGKVVLAHAERGHDHLQQAWIVDSTPEARPPAGSAWEMLGAIRAMPGAFGSRAEAGDLLKRAGYSAGVAAWMTSNLEHDQGRYVWSLDFDAIETMLRDFFVRDFWGVVEAPPEDTVLHFVKATESSTLSPEAAGRIEDAGRRHGRAFVHRLPGGHWLHVDNPDGLLDLLVRHLS